MDSRISIKADFERNTPYIEVQYKPSDDAKDDMVGAFSEKLNHTSTWAHIEYRLAEASTAVVFRIYPIQPEQFNNHISRMQEASRVWNEFHSEMQYKAQTIDTVNCAIK